tara:strand:+ start:15349 stop:15957 length:609 start_codon:yes stop_codon:yes gene_type:complete
MAFTDIYRAGCGIDSPLDSSCKTAQGGINKLYLFPFVEYGLSEVVIESEVITAIPRVNIYEFDVWGASYSESTDVKNGNIVYNQSLNFTVPTTSPYRQLFRLLKKDHCAVYIDRQGNTRIVGLWNGCQVSYSNKTGANKSDMNGYEISLSGMEDNQAYWISDLEGLFEVISPTVDTEDIEDYLFQDGDNFIFQDNDNYIFNS